MNTALDNFTHQQLISRDEEIAALKAEIQQLKVESKMHITKEECRTLVNDAINEKARELAVNTRMEENKYTALISDEVTRKFEEMGTNETLSKNACEEMINCKLAGKNARTGRQSQKCSTKSNQH